ncbi:hypothetical protein B0H13DRAFT_1897088 [Mycena leptocephala]|nr:hypothetical protein B0H13DRAFT_1897088 [Mycena leptocephala]
MRRTPWRIKEWVEPLLYRVVLAGEQSEVEAILTACNRVTNLYDNFQFIVNVHAIQQLRRLALPLETFLERCPVDSVSSFFRNLTHLELLGHNAGWEEEDDTRLHCFVFFKSENNHLEYIDKAELLLGNDRLVWMEQKEDFRADWLRGAYTGNDYWVLAEAFIAAKREGKVGREVYGISDRDEWWDNK